MSDRPPAERDRYHLARPLAPDLSRLMALIGTAGFLALLLLEPEHRLAKALVDLSNRLLTFITQL